MERMVAVCCLGLALVFNATLQAQEAKAFSSKAGRFSVQFPNEPKEQVQSKDTPVGKTDIHLFISEAGADGGYIVSYNDYTSGSVTPDNREKMLDGAQNGAVTTTKGTIKSAKKITLGKEKHSGREFLMVMPDGKIYYRSRIFSVGDRLYQVIAVGAEEFVSKSDSTKFMDTFRITAATK